MKEVQRYYRATFANGASITFRADNSSNAWDHAAHAAYAENLGKVRTIEYIGRTEPANCGAIQTAVTL